MPSLKGGRTLTRERSLNSVAFSLGRTPAHPAAAVAAITDLRIRSLGMPSAPPGGLKNTQMTRTDLRRAHFGSTPTEARYPLFMGQLSLPLTFAMPRRPRPQIRTDRRRVQFMRAQFTKTSFNRLPTPTALPRAQLITPLTLTDHLWAALSLTRHRTDTEPRKERSFMAEERRPSTNLQVLDTMLHRMKVTDPPLVGRIPGDPVEV